VPLPFLNFLLLKVWFFKNISHFLLYSHSYRHPFPKGKGALHSTLQIYNTNFVNIKIFDERTGISDESIHIFDEWKKRGKTAKEGDCLKCSDSG